MTKQSTNGNNASVEKLTVVGKVTRDEVVNLLKATIGEGVEPTLQEFITLGALGKAVKSPKEVLTRISKESILEYIKKSEVDLEVEYKNKEDEIKEGKSEGELELERKDYEMKIRELALGIAGKFVEVHEDYDKETDTIVVDKLQASIIVTDTVRMYAANMFTEFYPEDELTNEDLEGFISDNVETLVDDVLNGHVKYDENEKVLYITQQYLEILMVQMILDVTEDLLRQILNSQSK